MANAIAENHQFIKTPFVTLEWKKVGRIKYDSL